MEQGAGEVRVMTVHGAKGLEAPIVILPDTAGGHESRRGDPLLMLEGSDGHAKVPLWPVPKLAASRAVKQMKAMQKDVELAEYRRLLYVAMTRARDELYVCGYRGAREPMADCWDNTMLAALKEKMTPLDGERGWRLGAAPLPAEGEASQAVAQGPAWPAWIGRELELAAAAASEAPQPRRRGPAQVERGILIHRILQNLPDLAPEQRAAHIATAVKRAGADPALAQQLGSLLDNPVLAEILSGDGHSEAQLIIQGPAGPERRRIDRLVITPSGILVADYKTDREVPDAPEACNPEYLMQMAIYREALRLTEPGKPLRFCLVFTEAPKLLTLPDELLDRMAALRQPRP